MAMVLHTKPVVEVGIEQDILFHNCRICDERVPTYTYPNHLWAAHREVENLPCGICAMAIGEITSLQAHIHDRSSHDKATDATPEDSRPCCVWNKSGNPENTMLCNHCDGLYYTACVDLEKVCPGEKWLCVSCDKSFTSEFCLLLKKYFRVGKGLDDEARISGVQEGNQLAARLWAQFKGEQGVKSFGNWLGSEKKRRDQGAMAINAVLDKRA